MTRSALPVAILCGGKGTRMREDQPSLPKPLVEIGGRPILWHVMALYAAQGFARFVLLLGHGAEQVRAAASDLDREWSVTCVDTGLDTPTGGRVARVATHLEGDTFCLTYADGVADIDLAAQAELHQAKGAVVTMTVVRPHSQWGVATIDREDRITGFAEKPRLDQWINGGFLVCEPAFLDYLDEDSVLERQPLARVAAAGGLAAFRHEGFWDCMDTYKDAVTLNDLWELGDAPWRIWDGAGITPRSRRPKGEAEPGRR